MRTAHTLTLLFLALIEVSGQTNSSINRPNVIIIITDDQGYGDLSINGHPYLKTPHLDELARKSLRLTNFHVAPVCAPTRSQLMTGLDAFHNGSYSPHGQHHLMDPSLRTMGNIFKDNGYNTALYGKWHLGGNFQGYRPHERGFDDAVYFLRGGHWSHPNPWNSDCMDDTYYHNGKRAQYKGYATDLWFDLGKKFINKSLNENKPFLLYLPLNAPHIPWLSPERYRENYYDKGLSKNSINFYAMLASVDENIGSLVRFLSEQQTLDNTILIFTTDNGSTLWEQEYNAGMRGQKGSVYEGGHRVPCFIHWPSGNFGEPRDITSLTEVQDLLPTLMNLCHFNTDGKLAFDGKDISPLLRDESNEELENRVEIVQCYDEKYKGSIMWKNWRLVNGKELYNLNTDFDQDHNIFDDHPDITTRLLEHYHQWWETILWSRTPYPYFIDGSETVQLTAYDWYDGPRVYNWPHLRNGDKSNGRYKVAFQQAKEYQISLRRWPKESNAAICGSVPTFEPFDTFLGSLPVGKALDIVKAKVKIGDQILEKEVTETDREVRFKAVIPEGETHLQTWFVDSNQEEFGAYYVYIE